jgi:hypothetical protein
MELRCLLFLTAGVCAVAYAQQTPAPTLTAGSLANGATYAAGVGSGFLGAGERD